MFLKDALKLFFSPSSNQRHVPSQAFCGEISISNSTDPGLGPRHQPVGWLPLPSTEPKAQRAHAPPRWVESSGFPSEFSLFSFQFFTWNTCLQVNPRFVWPATVRLSMDPASPSLRSWSTRHARRRTPTGSLYGMNTARMVWSWRPQVLPKSPARPSTKKHHCTI